MYQTLDTSVHEIRLLRILPGQPSDEIEAQIVVTALDNQPEPYEALSYVWGHTSDPPNQINVDGVPRNVTSNLHRALRRVRRVDQLRLFWVDAICINQSDISERNHQVRLMRQVYAGATRVIAWLGDHDDATRLPEDAKAEQHNPSFHDGSALAKGIAAIELLTSSNDIHWDDERVDIAATVHIPYWLRSPWWFRVWTVQEAAVAQSLVYMMGKAEIPGGKFASLLRSFDYHVTRRRCCQLGSLEHNIDLSGRVGYSFQGIKSLHELSRRLKEQKTAGGALGLSISSSCALFRPRDATDPRDKVYAFIGLSRGLQTSWVDYSLSVESTYEAAARECILSVKRLDVLFYCYFWYPSLHWPREFLELPSWVPDWTLRLNKEATDFVALRDDLIHYRTTGDGPGGWLACGILCEAVVSRQDPSGNLGVSGHLFDTIAKLGAAYPQEYWMDFGVFQGWRLISGVEKDPMSAYVGHETRLDAYRRTVCMDTSSLPSIDHYKPATDESDHMAHDTWWSRELCLMKDPRGVGASDLTRYDQMCRSYRSMVMRCAIGRAFFVSKKGYFGLAPSTAQVGDQVCILEGGRMPFILRESGTAVLPDIGTVRAFKLIGDSYVHGIMNGEAVADVEEGRASLERWALV
ncbi:hypothetical protein MAPG_02210 [Magnaporthiopsis poae ATCC 64411]|uniref:Heterokaryon incompatibility domain-containing protein n=1 Tax=Magnaporthiopsis poae (strain ATCC 64411 / 73-15) TaxID=644358 RepID=A0A0C4DQR4_MAGP6|nr:hypothetical protein MAPG_02210 [Magnaporthiopsis poae ATCC 64411]